MGREFHLELLRRFEDAPATAKDQSGFIRTAVELLVGATEKVAADLKLAEEYAAAAGKDSEGEAFREGALAAGADIWGDA